MRSAPTWKAIESIIEKGQSLAYTRQPNLSRLHLNNDTENYSKSVPTDMIEKLYLTFQGLEYLSERCINDLSHINWHKHNVVDASQYKNFGAIKRD